MNKIEKLHEEAIEHLDLNVLSIINLDLNEETKNLAKECSVITKDIAVKFSLWQQQGDCEWVLNDEDEWYIPYNPHVKINTEQLFNIFIETL